MKRIGMCALCKKECFLSFEHIPPQSAFNRNRVKSVSSASILSDTDRLPWDIDGLKYDNLQKGFGYYSLCQTCNNNTGAWYGNAYNDFARLSSTYIQDYLNGNLNPTPKPDIIEFRNIYPLHVIKQIASMFCSVNSSNSSMDDLCDAILHKECNSIDKRKYRFYLYFNLSNLMRVIPFSVAGFSTGLVGFSEIATFPLGLIVIVNPGNNINHYGVEITDFWDFDYNQLANIAMPAYVREVNSAIPLDFHTKEQIISSMEQKLIEDD